MSKEKQRVYDTSMDSGSSARQHTTPYTNWTQTDKPNTCEWRLTNWMTVPASYKLSCSKRLISVNRVAIDQYRFCPFCGGLIKEDET